MRFKLAYFITFLLLLFTEILIALYIHEAFIRPYLGDFLVVILIYCFVRAFFIISVKTAAIGTLIFAYAVELLQFVKIVEILDLQDIKLARILIGTAFSWLDVLAYTLGIIFVLLVENYYHYRIIKLKK